MISLWYFPTCMNISLGLEGIAWAWTSCNLLTNYPECGDIHFGCNLQEAEHVGAPKMSNCCHLVFCMRDSALSRTKAKRDLSSEAVPHRDEFEK